LVFLLVLDLLLFFVFFSVTVLFFFFSSSPFSVDHGGLRWIRALIFLVLNIPMYFSNIRGLGGRDCRQIGRQTAASRPPATSAAAAARSAANTVDGAGFKMDDVYMREKNVDIDEEISRHCSKGLFPR
jgi:hypothetical protein